ncbi:MAG: Calx-beta domain-containing protein, partial [Limisphaerales bacterium]
MLFLLLLALPTLVLTGRAATVQFSGLTQTATTEHTVTVTINVTAVGALPNGGSVDVFVTGSTIGGTVTAAAVGTAANADIGSLSPATTTTGLTADVTARRATLTWAANDTVLTKQVTYTPTDDSLVEGPEGISFSFVLLPLVPMNDITATAAPATSTQVINDNDLLVAFTSPYFMVREDGQEIQQITVRTFPPIGYVSAGVAISATWQTASPPASRNAAANGAPNTLETLLRPGSDWAQPGADYTANSGTLNWAANGADGVGALNAGGTAVTKTVPQGSIAILQDTLVEQNEDIMLQLRVTAGNANMSRAGSAVNTGIPDFTTYGIGTFNVRSNAVMTIVFDDPPAGALDHNFNSVVISGGVAGAIPNPGANNTVLAVVLQPDGRVLLGGDFTAISGTNNAINRIGRVTALGRPDPTFLAGAGTGADGYVQTIALYGNTVPALDQKIMIGGGFTAIGGVSRPGIARLDSTGNLDPLFNPGVGANGPVRALAIQPADGKVIVAGEFTFINGVARNRIARLNTDGTVDTTFNPGNGANDIVYAVVIHPANDPVIANQGKIVVAGDFTMMDTVAASRVTRLNADGTVDTGFTPGNGADATVRALLIDADGKPVLGGNFTTMDGARRPGVVRLTTAGVVDPTFGLYTSGTTNVYALALDTSVNTGNANNNGKLLVGGFFKDFNSTYRKCIVRLNTNGMVDTSFLDRAYNQNAGLLASENFPLAVNDPAVAYALAVQPLDSSVIVGGSFASVGGAERQSAGGTIQGLGIVQGWVTRTNTTKQLNFTRLVGRWGTTAGVPNPAQGPGSVIFNVPTLGVVENSTPFARFAYQRIPEGFITGGIMNGNVRFHYATSNLTATAGLDYTTVNTIQSSGPILFPVDWDSFANNGQGPQMATSSLLIAGEQPIPVLPDFLVEGNEEFLVTLLSIAATNFNVVTPLAGTYPLPAFVSVSGRFNEVFGVGNPVSILGVYSDLGVTKNYDDFDITTDPTVGFQGQMTVTILDDDFTPGTLGFTAPADFTTNENAGSITITVNRTAGSVGPVSIDYTTVEPTLAARAGNTLTVSPPLIVQRFQNGNRVIFSTVGNGTLPTGITAGTQYEITGLVGNTFSLLTTTTPQTPVVLSSSFTGTCKVQLADYTAVAGTLNFASGQTNKTITIPLVDNTYINISAGGVSYTRIVDIVLSNPTGGATPGAQLTATLTIGDNETLNAPAGSVDTGFSPSVGPNLPVNAVDVYLSDYTGPGILKGQVMVAGDFVTFNGLSRNRLTRLKLDGSLDTAFNIGTGANNSIRALAIHPITDLLNNNASKVVIGGDFTIYNGQTISRIARVNNDGSRDTGFNPGSGANGTVRGIAFHPDGDANEGKIVIVGDFTQVNGFSRNGVARLLADGSVDPAFNPGTGAAGNTGVTNVVGVAIHPFGDANAGKIVIVGDFTSVNGTALAHVARLNHDGSVDTGFDSLGLGAQNGFVHAVAIVPPGDSEVANRGKILVGGDFTSMNSVTALAGLARLNQNGSVDFVKFDQFSGAFIGVAGGGVRAISLDQNGKIVISGNFTTVNSLGRNRIAQLNQDGSVDVGINFGSGADGIVNAIGLQPDTKQIVIGGAFLNYDGTARKHLAQIVAGIANAGSGNVQFTSPTYTVTEDVGVTGAPILVKRTGGLAGSIKVSLTTANGTAIAGASPPTGINSTPDYADATAAGNVTFRPGQATATNFVTIHDDAVVDGDKTVNLTLSLPTGGTLDPTFTALGTGPNQLVRGVAVLPLSKKIVLVGDFTSVNGVSFNGVALLDINGAPDLAFSAAISTGANGPVRAVAVDGSDNIYIGGDFTSFGATAVVPRLAKLNVAGVFDAPFNTAIDTGVENGSIRAIVLSGGNLYVGGTFTIVDGAARQKVAKISTGGTLDPTFNPASGINGDVSALATDGANVVVGGTFTIYAAATSLPGVVRVDGGSGAPLPFTPPAPPGVMAVNAVAVDGNGRILVGGDFTGGGFPNRLFQLANDGTLDATAVAFNSAIGSSADSAILAIRVLRDGKIAVGGSFLQFKGAARTNIVRLTATGAIDTNFDPGQGGNSAIRAVEQDTSGRLVVAGDFTTYDGTPINRVARLGSIGAALNIGSVDPTFVVTNAGVNGIIRAFAIHPPTDPNISNRGKIVIVGDFTSVNGLTRNYVARLNFSGSVEETFDPGVALGVNSSVNAVAIDDFGDILIGGVFASVGGVPRTENFAKISAAGAAQSTFANAAFTGGGLVGGPVNSISIDRATDSIYVGGAFTTLNGAPVGGVVKLAGDVVGNGTPQPFPANITGGAVNSVYWDPNASRLVIGGSFTTYDTVPATTPVSRNRVARLQPSGALDTAFDPGVGPNAMVRAVYADTSSRVIIGGDFVTVGPAAGAPLLTPPTTQNFISRLTAGGVVDGSFGGIGTGANGIVRSISADTLAGGYIYIGGDFTAVNAVSKNRVARLGTSGSLHTFNPPTGADNSVYGVGEEPASGDVVMVGSFLSVNSQPQLRIARVSTSGTSAGPAPVVAFQNLTAGVDGLIRDFAQLSDGRVVIVGDFTAVHGVSRPGVAVLNQDGLLDLSFNPGSGVFDGVSAKIVRAVAVLPGSPDRIAIGGNFIQYRGATRIGLALLGTDGLEDATFAGNLGVLGINGFSATVWDLAVDASGKLLVAGDFGFVNASARTRIARLLTAGPTSGQVDPTFDTVSFADNPILAVALDSSGRVIVGGSFASYGGSTHNGLARLLPSGALDVSFAPAGGFITAPAAGVFEVSSVAVDASDNVIIGGFFTQIKASARVGVARLLRDDGGLDASFQPATLSGGSAQVFKVLVEESGNVVIAGSFSQVGSITVPSTARLFAGSGALDGNFTLGSGPSSTLLVTGPAAAVQAAFLQANGKLLVGGSFLSINGTAANRLARLCPVAALTIQDNDSAVGFTASSFSVNESGVNAPISVVRTGFTNSLVNVSFATVAGTATPGQDYTTVAGTLTFSAGVTNQSFSVPITPDTTVEGNENLTITLSTPSPANSVGLGLSTATLTIVDDDFSAGQLGFTQAAVSVDENVVAASITLTVTRSGGSAGVVTVFYTTSDGPAQLSQLPGTNATTVNADYGFRSGTLSWADGDATSRTIIVPITDDSTVEGPENFSVTLSAQTGGAALNPATTVQVVTINDNDSSLQFSQPTYEVNETPGGTTRRVFVQRTGGPLGTVTVQLITADPSVAVPLVAVANSDYTAIPVLTPVTLQWLPGDTTDKFHDIPIIDDQRVELDQTFEVRLQNVAGPAVLGAQSTALVTIRDNDNEIGFASLPYSVSETNSTVTLTVGRLRGTAGDVTVYYSTIDGTAISSDSDLSLRDYAPTLRQTKFVEGVTVLSRIDLTAHEFVDGDPVVFNLASGALPAPLAAGVTYTVANRTDNRFGLKLNGADVTFPGSGFSGTVPVTRHARKVELVNFSFSKITITGHGLLEGNTIAFAPDSVALPAGALPQPLVANFAYVVTNTTPDTFQVASNGAVVTLLSGFVTPVAVRSALYWASGDIAPKTFKVAITDDTRIEVGDEKFFVGLTADAAVTSYATVVGANPATVTILDNDVSGGGVDTRYALSAGVNDVVLASAVQDDLKVLAVGQFTTFNGAVRGRVVRLNTDGTLDTGFLNAPLQTGADLTVNAVAIDRNQSPLLAANVGKIIIGGLFNNVSGAVPARPRVARLLADGSVDSTFTASPAIPGTVHAVAVQPDGKVLVAGSFTVGNRQNVLRLLDNGTLDPSFIPNNLPGANAEVRALLVQGDGKILIGGDFTSVNNTNVYRVARLNSDGNLDTAFSASASAGANAMVRALLLDVDNTIPLSPVTNIVVAGDFTNPSFGTAVITKSLSGNKATLTTAVAHGLNPGNVVVVEGVDSTFNGPCVVLGGLDAPTTVAPFTFKYDRIAADVASTAVSPVGSVALQSQPVVNRVARLNMAGVLDTTFSANVGTGPNGIVRTLATYNNGVTAANRKFLLGGDFIGAGFGVAVTHKQQMTLTEVQLTTAIAHNLLVGDLVTVTNVSSTLDGTYTVTAKTDTTFKYLRSATATDPSAVPLTSQGSATHGGVLHNRIAQLNNVGRVETVNNTTPQVSFGLGFDNPVNTISTQTNQAVANATYYIVGGNFTNYNGLGGPGYDYLLRLSGTTLDRTFDLGTAADGNVLALAPAPGNRLVVGGAFNTLNGVLRSQVGRFNEDGTLDTTFAPLTIAYSGGSPVVNALTVDTNTNPFLALNLGKVLIAGQFTSIGGTPRTNLARLMADGSLDGTFLASPLTGPDNTVNAVAVQADGRVVIAGQFTTVNGTSRNRIARLNTDGSLDASFMSGLAGADGAVFAVLLDEANNHIYVAGDFSTIHGTGRSKVARLFKETVLPNLAGSLDVSFVPRSDATTPASLNGAVRALALTTPGTVPAGDLLIGGAFTTLGGVTDQRRVARLSNVGVPQSFLTGPQGADGTVLAIQVQADGKFIFGGQFTTFAGQTRNRIARLNVAGTALDPVINFGSGANGDVNSILVQGDRRVVLGGGFTTFNAQPAAGLVRLEAGDNDSPAGGTFSFSQSAYTPTESETAGFVTITVNRIGGLAGSVTVKRETASTVVTADDSADTFTRTAHGLAHNTEVRLVSGGALPSGLSSVTPYFVILQDANTFQLSASFGGPFVNFSGVGSGTHSYVLATTVLTADSVLGTLNRTAHGLVDGTAIRLVNYGGALPAGLVAGRTYYVINAAPNSFKLSQTLGGTTAEAFTDAGTGIHAYVPAGTALATTDYSPLFSALPAEDLVFADGQQSRTFNVSLNKPLDSTPEVDHSVGLRLLNSSGASVLATAQLVIRDDDSHIGFPTATASISEGVSTLTVNVRRIGGSAGVVTVDYATFSDTGFGKALQGPGAGTDYNAASATLTFADGVTNQSFTVTITEDPTSEGDETFVINLSNAIRLNGQPGGVTAILAAPGGSSFAGQTVFPSQTVTILDNETSPGSLGFSVITDSVNEGVASGLKTVVVQRSGGSFGAVNVDYAVTGGTATGGGVDFTRIPATLSFANGESSKSFDVTITSDPLPEGDETVVLQLSNFTGGATPTVGFSTLTLTIVDNDSAVAFSQPAYVVSETNGTVTLTANRSGGSNSLISVFYATVAESGSGKAKAFPDVNYDYVGTPGADVSVTAFGASALTVGALHPFIIGDPVVFMGDLPNGLIAGVTYQVAIVGPTDIQLTLNGVAVASLGTGGTTATARRGAVTVAGMDIAADTLQFAGHGFVTGQRVVVAGTTLPGGLSATEGYVVTNVTAGAFALATNGVVVDLAGAFPNTAVAVRPALLWAAGDIAPKTFVVSIRDDLDKEPIENFTVTLAAGSTDVGTLSVTTPSAQVLIRDNDTLGGAVDGGYGIGLGPDNTVTAVAVQTNGQVVVAGTFGAYNGTTRNRVLRINSDGTLDVGFFTSPVGADNVVNAVAIDRNVNPLVAINRDKVVIGGLFNSVNGTARSRVARLMADGSVDPNFTPPTGPAIGGTVHAVAVQPDGKVLVAGSFTVGNRQNVLRLLDNGTLDPSFIPNLPGFGANAEVRALLVQGDGKILIGGDFTSVNGTNANRVARLTSDGNLDTAFTASAGGGANAMVRALLLDVDYTIPLSPVTRIVVAGDFTGPSFGVAVTNKALIGNLVTLTTAGDHGFPASAAVEFAGLGAPFDGLRLVTASGNTLTYNLTAADVPSAAVSPVGSVALQSQPVNRVARLNMAGVLDTTFSGNVGTGPNGSVRTLATYSSDGTAANRKFLLGGDFTGAGFGVAVSKRQGLPGSGGRLAELTTLAPHGLSVGDIVVISGVNDPANILLPDVSFDGTYVVTSGTPTGTTFQYERASGTASGLFTLPTPGFATKANRSQTRFARLNHDGSLDTTVNSDTGFNAAVNVLALQTNGGSRVVVGGSFTSYDGIGGLGHDYLALLTLPTTFTPGTALPLDPAFNPAAGADNAILSLAVEPGAGGRTVIGGLFTSFNGNPAAARVARINADGTLDSAGFTSPAFLLTAGTPAVNAVALDLNTNLFLGTNVGKVVVGGAFTSVGGTARNRIVRLSGDGTPDLSFNPGSGADNTVNAVAVQQADGRVLLAGAFSSVNGVARGGIARLNADGSLDTTFMNALSGADAEVRAILLDEATVTTPPGGYVYVAGDFNNVNGTLRSRVARLFLATGALDTAGFIPPTALNGVVRALARDASGNLYFGGDFTSLNNGGTVTRNRLARLSSGGTLDTTFLASAGSGADNFVTALRVQPDGKILVGGAFTSLNGQGRAGLARLNNDASGTLDATINFGSGASAQVNAVGVQADGRLVAAGAFTSFNGTAAGRIVRLDGGLNNDAGTFNFSQQLYPALESAGTAVITVVRTGGLAGTAPLTPVTVPFTANFVIGGAALAALPASPLSFAAGQATNSFTLTLPSDDLTVEADVDVALALGAPNNGNGGALGTTFPTATLRIQDDDSVIGFAQSAYTVSEATTTASVTVARLGGVAGTVLVDFATVAETIFGAATVGADYTGVTNTLTFTNGVTNLAFSVTIGPDNFTEGNEFVTLALFNARPQVVGGASAVMALPAGTPGNNPVVAAGFGVSGTVHTNAALTILDDESAPGALGFSALAYRVDETDSGGVVQLLVSVQRTGGSAGTVTAQYSTANGTATNGVFSVVPGATTGDYTGVTNTLTFANGVISNGFLVDIHPDTLAEGDETFTLLLSSLTGGASNGILNATVTIVDNDSALAFTQSAYLVGETNGSVPIIVRRTGGTNSLVSATYSTTDGTAKAAPTLPETPDYTAIPVAAQTLTGAAVTGGDTLAVTGHGLTVGNPVVFAGGALPAFGLVANFPYVVTNAVPASANALRLLSNGTLVALSAPVTATIQPALVWAVGDDTNKTFIVPILDDFAVEGAQSLTVSLVAGSTVGGTVAVTTPAAVVTILDNDGIGGVVEGGLALGAGPDGAVNATAVQTNGQVVVAGAFTSYNGVLRGRVLRLNADGTLDPAFLGVGAGADGAVNAVAVDANSNPLFSANRDRIVIGGSFNNVNGTPRLRLARLNADGSLDGLFASPVSAGTVSAVAVQADGKVLVAGGFTAGARQNLARLTADNGALDPLFLGTGPDGEVRALLVVPETDPVEANRGKILIAGDFTTVNGTPARRVARLNRDGSVDLTFDARAGANAMVRTILPDVAGYVVGGDFTGLSFASVVTNKALSALNVATLTTTGHPFAPDDVVTVSIGDPAFDGTYTVLATPVPGISFTYTKTGTPVSSTAVIPSGLAGVAANRLAKLNNSGVLDVAFSARIGTGPDGGVTALTTFGTGINQRFLVGGTFTNAGFGVAVTNRSQTLTTVTLETVVSHGLAVGDVVVVTNVSTTLDGTYAVTGVSGRTFSYTVGTSVPATGNIAVAPALASATRGNAVFNRIAQLKADGTVDTAVSFGSGFDSTVSTLALQTLGTTTFHVVGGAFASYNGFSGPGYDSLVRLNAGIPDRTFNQGAGADATINALAFNAAGQMVVGGQFTNVSGLARARVARFNLDGTLDTAFTPAALSGGTAVNAVAVDLNTNAFLGGNIGKVVVGGTFAFTNANLTLRSRIARLNADGTLDNSFLSNLPGADNTVNAVAVQQADGRVLLAGAFSSVNGVARG